MQNCIELVFKTRVTCTKTNYLSKEHALWNKQVWVSGGSYMSNIFQIVYLFKSQIKCHAIKKEIKVKMCLYLVKINGDHSKLNTQYLHYVGKHAPKSERLVRLCWIYVDDYIWDFCTLKILWKFDLNSDRSFTNEKWLSNIIAYRPTILPCYIDTYLPVHTASGKARQAVIYWYVLYRLCRQSYKGIHV